MLGFMIGSLRKIWPFKSIDGTNILPQQLKSEELIAIGLFIVGFMAIIIIELVSKSKNTKGAE